LKFQVSLRGPLPLYQRIAPQARALRATGLSMKAIGRELRVDEKTVKKALGFNAARA